VELVFIFIFITSSLQPEVFSHNVYTTWHPDKELTRKTLLGYFTRSRTITAANYHWTIHRYVILDLAVEYLRLRVK